MSALAAFPPCYLEAWGDLTPREREVCALLARGLTARQAADVLFVSYHTVREHLRNVGGKLPGDGPTQARAIRAYAVRCGAST